MNTKVQKYIKSQKTAFLIKEGLYDKIYEPENVKHDPDEFPRSELGNGDRTKYYKIVPYEVADEELETIIKLRVVNSEQTASKIQTNKIGTFMIISAVLIYIFGLIVGCLAGNNNPYSPYFSFSIAAICWAIAFIVGSLFIGIAGIIKK